ncbi:MAG TPA: hypothetical protein PKZ61_17260, partial [Thermoflexales bacterium]|nr:hypothetical protein [Thermoflexales bacterium]
IGWASVSQGEALGYLIWPLRGRVMDARSPQIVIPRESAGPIPRPGSVEAEHWFCPRMDMGPALSRGMTIVRVGPAHSRG